MTPAAGLGAAALHPYAAVRRRPSPRASNLEIPAQILENLTNIAGVALHHNGARKCCNLLQRCEIRIRSVSYRENADAGLVKHQPYLIECCATGIVKPI